MFFHQNPVIVASKKKKIGCSIKKKLVAFAAVIAAVSFASCGNKSAESTESVAETEEATVVEEAPVVEEDAAATDSVAVEVTDSVAVEAAPAE